MDIRLIAVVAACAALLAPPAGLAKGETVYLSITGPGLDVPLHTSDDALISANVWAGNFADWEAGPVEAAVDDQHDYRVFFWTRMQDWPVEMSYVLRYRWDESAERALLCLPGRRDPWYTINTYSILRRVEGSCFHATPEWGAALRAALAQ